MCSIPLKFYENDIQNSTVVIKNTTINSPIINFAGVNKINNADYTITKLEFLDSNGKWIEPTGRNRQQKPDPNAYPYSIYTWGSDSSYLISLWTKQDTTNSNLGRLDIPNTTGKIGIRVYMCGKMVYQLTNFSESHVTKDFALNLWFNKNSKINIYIYEKTLN